METWEPCDFSYQPQLVFFDGSGRDLEATVSRFEWAVIKSSEPCFYGGSFRVRLPKTEEYVVGLHPAARGQFFISYETLRARGWVWNVTSLLTD
jgi:hypothetical protein